MIEFENILIAIVGLVGTALGAILNKLFTTKKDFVDIQSSVINNLWEEINRLKNQVDELKSRELNYEIKEKELTVRIADLEKENIKQASEIKELKLQLSIYVKNN